MHVVFGMGGKCTWYIAQRGVLNIDLVIIPNDGLAKVFTIFQSSLMEYFSLEAEK